jgi:hypothetical protein
MVSESNSYRTHYPMSFNEEFVLRLTYNPHDNSVVGFVDDVEWFTIHIHRPDWTCQGRTRWHSSDFLATH